MKFATRERDLLEMELKKRNQAIINSRLTAVNQSYHAKKLHIESTRKKVSNESILRMYEGQLRKMEEHHRVKVGEIMSKDKVGVTLSLFMRACFEVIGSE
jgi:hypothetical protein